MTYYEILISINKNKDWINVLDPVCEKFLIKYFDKFPNRSRADLPKLNKFAIKYFYKKLSFTNKLRYIMYVGTIDTFNKFKASLFNS